MPTYSVWRPSLIIILAVWAYHWFSLTAAQAFVLPNAEDIAVRRLLPMSVGIALSLLIVAAIRKVSEKAVWSKVVVVLLAAWLIPIPYALMHLAIFPEIAPGQTTLQRMSGMWSGFSHLFFAIAIAVVTVDYSVKLREREHRFDRVAHLAREAELRALQYQVNPHFLFNALNSVASLLSDREVTQAETMVENLADYYQQVLASGPDHEVPLKDELETQATYLAIERVRFPERLEVSTNISPDLEMALVPRLILQPLVENVVKHSSARTDAKVCIKINARAEGPSVILEVRNSSPGGPLSEARTKRVGTGLRNIEDRLQALYGSDASVKAGPTQNGFSVTISLPLRIDS